MFDIIHPTRRNLTAIRGYVRLGGYEDDPRRDPQDRSWFGPSDRLFLPEEAEELEFQSAPEYGEPFRMVPCSTSHASFLPCVARILAAGIFATYS